jgi:hypothetical protein
VFPAVPVRHTDTWRCSVNVKVGFLAELMLFVRHSLIIRFASNRRYTQETTCDRIRFDSSARLYRASIRTTVMTRTFQISLLLIVAVTSISDTGTAKDAAAENQTEKTSLAAITSLMDKYCLDCHGDSDAAAGLNLKGFDPSVALGSEAWDTTRWEKICRMAVGGLERSPGGITVRLPADCTQDAHVDGLPFGTRGGTLFVHQFPADGQYEIQLRLMRERDENLEGLTEPHDIDVLLDRHLVHRFTVTPPKGKVGYDKAVTLVDAHLKKRFLATAGPHKVGVTFPRKFSSLLEIKWQPFDVSFNRHRHPRRAPALFEVSIVGPFDPEGPGNTPSL